MRTCVAKVLSGTFLRTLRGITGRRSFLSWPELLTISSVCEDPTLLDTPRIWLLYSVAFNSLFWLGYDFYSERYPTLDGT